MYIFLNQINEINNISLNYIINIKGIIYSKYENNNIHYIIKDDNSSTTFNLYIEKDNKKLYIINYIVHNYLLDI